MGQTGYFCSEATVLLDLELVLDDLLIRFLIVPVGVGLVMIPNMGRSFNAQRRVANDSPAAEEEIVELVNSVVWDTFLGEPVREGRMPFAIAICILPLGALAVVKAESDEVSSLDTDTGVLVDA